MKTTWSYIGLSAILLAVFITETLPAAPARSPYGGIIHPTCASQRQRQQQVSSRSQYHGRCKAGTRRSTGWSSHSSRIPENLSTFRWGWWDLKDRW